MIVDTRKNASGVLRVRRCRLHGGKSTGAPIGNRNALKHGDYTAEAILLRKQINLILRESRRTISEIRPFTD